MLRGGLLNCIQFPGLSRSTLQSFCQWHYPAARHLPALARKLRARGGALEGYFLISQHWSFEIYALKRAAEAASNELCWAITQPLAPRFLCKVPVCLPLLLQKFASNIHACTRMLHAIMYETYTAAKLKTEMQTAL